MVEVEPLKPGEGFTDEFLTFYEDALSRSIVTGLKLIAIDVPPEHWLKAYRHGKPGLHPHEINMFGQIIRIESNLNVKKFRAIYATETP